MNNDLYLKKREYFPLLFNIGNIKKKIIFLF